jgi:hypothetical protein
MTVAKSQLKQPARNLRQNMVPVTDRDSACVRHCSECHEPYLPKSATKPELTCCSAHQRDRIARRQREYRQRRRFSQSDEILPVSTRLRLDGEPDSVLRVPGPAPEGDDPIARLRHLHGRLRIQAARLLNEQREETARAPTLDVQHAVNELLGTTVHMLAVLDEVLWR